MEALRKCPYSRDAAIIGEVTEDQPESCHDYGDRNAGTSSAAGRRASAEDLLIIPERRVRSYGDKSGIDLDHCGKQ